MVLAVVLTKSREADKIVAAWGKRLSDVDLRSIELEPSAKLAQCLVLVFAHRELLDELEVELR